MAGWTHERRIALERAFYAYLDECYIESRDFGRISLGKSLYDGQRRFITEVFDGLENDIHKFYVLKSRQLGISTICRALLVFFIGIFRGVRGALVFDTAPNREEARVELISMIKNLPGRLQFPAVYGSGYGNRDAIQLVNGSRVLFRNAGVQKKKTSGTLGRSVGLSLAHLSEICSYDNDEGLIAFENSLSDSNPDRLYIYESTARGFNIWNKMWQRARQDPAHCKCIFLGWWSKESQQIEVRHRDFKIYGDDPPTREEMEKIENVRRLYNHHITMEQLAWIRRRMDPAAQQIADDTDTEEDDPQLVQEQPWTEDEAFQLTGSRFFSNNSLLVQTTKYVSNKYKSYMTIAGDSFANMKIYPAENYRMTDLKVWEEPVRGGAYCIACDPAFGENENNDRSSIQVGRCYADGIDQVAEYASPLINTQQLAWVIAALLGWYGETAEAYYILEINGPGTAVFNELRALRHQIDHAYFGAQAQEQGLQNIFRNVRTYIYTRPDAMTAGQNLHFKCLAVDTPIPIPTGWTTIGAIKVGDSVFNEQGDICRVLGCSDIMENHECFEVSFQDGTSIIADADHCWTLSNGQTVKTSELIAQKDTIICAKPLQLSDAINLPIHPYVLGVWLGDGYSESGRFCASPEDIDELIQNVSECGFVVGDVSQEKEPRTTCYAKIEKLHALLRDNNLLQNKHIPEVYLRGSYKQRLALLQGLMDTDGHIDQYCQAGFNTIIPELAFAFAELLRSLGIRSKFLIKNPLLQYKGKQVVCKPDYQFWFTAPEDMLLFRLSRKLNRQSRIYPNKRSKRSAHGNGGKSILKRSKTNRIVAIAPVDSMPVRCLEVDSPSHLFLVGAGMVPTHNTTNSLKVTIMEQLRSHVMNGLLRVRSMSVINEMKAVSREGDAIGAPSSGRDDAVVALALLGYYWETVIRKTLVTQKRTREAEDARVRHSVVDQVRLFQQNQLSSFFDRKRQSRIGTELALAKAQWRYGPARRY